RVPAGVTVQHAGTRREADGGLVSSGGRVLSVTATAATLGAARELAYEGLSQVALPGAHFRSDIAERAALGEIAVPT
ncbi:MAG: phosphoribosylamine--glycine ligase, partial [Actinomycetota bacterium]|nr:phosphoribosylamine--glycine ligase [Actinomycetota bacterium]